MNIARLFGTYADRTVFNIAKIVRLFSSDIGEKKNMPIEMFFNYVKTMPYRRDPAGREVIARPIYTMIHAPKIGRDCKKQSIMIASWALQNHYPYKFVIVSTKPDKKPHHIFVSICIRGRWIDYDATYNWNTINEKKTYTFRKEFEA